MKKYSFPLSRVMDWRRTHVQLEQAKLERLYAELHSLEARAEILRADVERSHKALVISRAATGAELAALDAFRRSAAAQCAHLETAALGCRKRIATQLDVITQRRREARLLERLHERKFAAWTADYAKEVDQQADELHLAARRSRIGQLQHGNASDSYSA
jgi:Asp/Glu/hydantoin racemase